MIKKDIFEKNKHEFNQKEAELKAQGLKFQTIVRMKSKENIQILILPDITDKGKALEYICSQHLKCSAKENVVAFGDSMNDCGMLQAVRKGVLVKNSQGDFIEWFYEQQKLIQQ